MILKIIKGLLSKRLRLADRQQELVHRSVLRRLRTESEAYRRLLAHLEELRQDHYLPAELDAHLPIDGEGLEVPDYLPEDL